MIKLFRILRESNYPWGKALLAILPFLAAMALITTFALILALQGC